MADPVTEYMQDDDYDFGAVPTGGDFGGSYDGPTGMFLLEFTDMGTPQPVKEQYQNPKKDRMRTWFEFTIVGDAKGRPDEDWDGEKVRIFMNISLWETATLRPCVDALFGGEIPAGVKPKKSLLLGRRAFGTILARPNQSDPSVMHAEITGWMPVEAVMNKKRTTGVGKSAAATDPATDDVPF